MTEIVRFVEQGNMAMTPCGWYVKPVQQVISALKVQKDLMTIPAQWGPIVLLGQLWNNHVLLVPMVIAP